VGWASRWADRVGARVTGWLDEVAEDGVVPSVARPLARVDVDRELIPGERLVEEVRHHWVLYVLPTLALLGTLVVGIAVLARTPLDVLWVPAVVLGGVAGWATYRIAVTAKDRFLVTDSRVVRVSGVFNRTAAWMPLGRVLDITVLRPWWLRPLRCGHLVLENAAQEQGLRDVRYVPDPGRHARLIHALRTHSDPGPAPRLPHGRPVDLPGRPWRGVGRPGH
jgi:hypothetical protein